MKRELPSLKKNLKSFILDEDAKIIDKTAVKVALTTSFLAVNFIVNADDAHARGHSNHSDHENSVNAPNNFGTGIHAGTNPFAEDDVNDVVINNLEIDPKSVKTVHGNHYNHADKSGGQSVLGSIIGAVAVAAAGGVGGGVAVAGVKFALVTNLAGIGLGEAALGAALAGAGAYVGGIALADADVDDIDADSPYSVPEPVLKVLESEED